MIDEAGPGARTTRRRSRILTWLSSDRIPPSAALSATAIWFTELIRISADCPTVPTTTGGRDRLFRPGCRCRSGCRWRSGQGARALRTKFWVVVTTFSTDPRRGSTIPRPSSGRQDQHLRDVEIQVSADRALSMCRPDEITPDPAVSVLLGDLAFADVLRDLARNSGSRRWCTRRSPVRGADGFSMATSIGPWARYRRAGRRALLSIALAYRRCRPHDLFDQGPRRVEIVRRSPVPGSRTCATSVSRIPAQLLRLSTSAAASRILARVRSDWTPTRRSSCSGVSCGAAYGEFNPRSAQRRRWHHLRRLLGLHRFSEDPSQELLANSLWAGTGTSDRASGLDQDGLAVAEGLESPSA